MLCLHFLYFFQVLLIIGHHFLLQVVDGELIVLFHEFELVADGLDVPFKTVDGGLAILFNLLVLLAQFSDIGLKHLYLLLVMLLFLHLLLLSRL